MQSCGEDTRLIEDEMCIPWQKVYQVRKDQMIGDAHATDCRSRFRVRGKAAVIDMWHKRRRRSLTNGNSNEQS